VIGLNPKPATAALSSWMMVPLGRSIPSTVSTAGSGQSSTTSLLMIAIPHSSNTDTGEKVSATQID
jgi:hypothetical protein